MNSSSRSSSCWLNSTWFATLLRTWPSVYSSKVVVKSSKPATGRQQERVQCLSTLARPLAQPSCKILIKMQIEIRVAAILLKRLEVMLHLSQRVHVRCHQPHEAKPHLRLDLSTIKYNPILSNRTYLSAASKYIISYTYPLQQSSFIWGFGVLGFCVFADFCLDKKIGDILKRNLMHKSITN